MKRYCPQCFRSFPTTVEVCPDDGAALISLDGDDLTGRTLDNRYVIRSVVGEGGMGIVYRAEQTLLGRVVALKVLRKNVGRTIDNVKRFLAEARAISSLRCPHTVTLYDFGVTSDGLLFYTMELLEGRPLSSIISEDGPLDLHRAANLVLQACDSLEESHDKGILHRDIKPDNLFVTRGWNDVELLKVLDFGIAKLKNDTGMGTLTQTGMICGTPAYVSPEQALNKGASTASDMYSLAVTFYETLAGRPPFEGESPVSLMMAHVHDTPDPVGRRNPSVVLPRSIEEFLSTALEKEPESRYRNTVEFRDGLKAALERCRSETEPLALPFVDALETAQQTDVEVETAPVFSDDDPLRTTESDRPALPPSTILETLTDDPHETDEAVLPALEDDETGRVMASISESGSPSNARWIVPAIFAGVLGLSLLFWQPWMSQRTTSVQLGSPPGDPAETTTLHPGPESEARSVSKDGRGEAVRNSVPPMPSTRISPEPKSQRIHPTSPEQERTFAFSIRQQSLSFWYSLFSDGLALQAGSVWLRGNPVPSTVDEDIDETPQEKLTTPFHPMRAGGADAGTDALLEDDMYRNNGVGHIQKPSKALTNAHTSAHRAQTEQASRSIAGSEQHKSASEIAGERTGHSKRSEARSDRRYLQIPSTSDGTTGKTTGEDRISPGTGPSDYAVEKTDSKARRFLRIPWTEDLEDAE